MTRMLRMGVLSVAALCFAAPAEGGAGSGGAPSAADTGAAKAGPEAAADEQPDTGGRVSAAQAQEAGPEAAAQQSDASAEGSGAKAFAEEVLETLTDVRQQLNSLDARISELGKNYAGQDQKLADLDNKVTHSANIAQIEEDLARAKLSLDAIGERTEKLETASERHEKVTGSIASADIEDRLKRVEDVASKALSAAGATDSKTTSAMVAKGDDAALREMARKLDIVWSQNGNR